MVPVEICRGICGGARTNRILHGGAPSFGRIEFIMDKLIPRGLFPVEFGKRNLVGIAFQCLCELAEGGVWKAGDFASGRVPAGAATVGLGGEVSGGVTSDVIPVRLLSRVFLYWSAKVVQLLLWERT